MAKPFLTLWIFTSGIWRQHRDQQRSLRRLTSCFKTAKPAAKARKAKEVEAEVGILSVDQTARLLEAADDRSLPYFAIGGFAGLRAAELHRLEWEDIDWHQKLILVRAKNAKSARRRLIKLRPNLAKWLQPYRKHTGRIVPAGFRKLELQTRERAKITHWPAKTEPQLFEVYLFQRVSRSSQSLYPMEQHTSKSVTIEVLSQRLGVKVRTIRTWMSSRKIPFLKISYRTVLFNPEEVVKALK